MTQSIDTRRRKITMAVVMGGTFVVLLDATVMNVAIPAIARDLDAAEGIEWVVTSYLVAVAVSQLMTGWFADRFGQRNVYVASLAVFGVGSLLATLATSLEYLVGARIIQGLGGGSIIPIGMALVYEMFPPEKRGGALGTWGVSTMTAPALGPVLGGYIATSASWRWIFAVNIPVCLIAVLAARATMPEFGERKRRPVPVLALAFAATGLIALLIAFDRVTEWGWTSMAFAGLLVVGLSCLVAFVFAELRSEESLIEVRMFAIPAFALTMAIVWFITASQFGRLLFVPLELQLVHGVTPFASGLALLPAAIGTAIVLPLGGRLTDRIGPKWPVTFGLSAVATALFLLSRTSPATGISTIAMILLLQGIGFGMAMMPNTITAMTVVPALLLNRASAARSLNRQVAASIGVALLISSVVASLGSLTNEAGLPVDQVQASYNRVYLIAALAVGASLTLALRLPDRRAFTEFRSRP